MTTPSQRPRPSLNLHGAVDLSSLSAPRPAAGANGGSGAGPGSSAIVEVSDASFPAAVVEQSMTVPVLLDFWATWCEPCKTLSPVLVKLANEFEGRFVLATVDADANPQLTQAFQVQSIPSVFAVVKGQPIPLFQGAQPEAQIRQVISEVLRLAEANGVTGRVDVAPGDADSAEEDVEEELPPHHQTAYDAIEAGDLTAAVSAYEAALTENPGDELARLGLAQVKLLQRTAEADPAAARAAAAADPADVDAQILVADIDTLGGHLEDAFNRLIDTVRITAGDERDKVRIHLIELFDVAGGDDPRVAPARLKLANALF